MTSLGITFTIVLVFAYLFFISAWVRTLGKGLKDVQICCQHGYGLAAQKPKFTYPLLQQENWELEKEFKFEAAHRLPYHDGKCKRLHGHSWKGRIHVLGYALRDSGPQTGMLVDYGVLKSIIDPLVEDKLDHYYLNDSLNLESPTSEAIAKYVYMFVHMRLALKGMDNFLLTVSIDETCTSRCTYRPSLEI